MKRIDGIFLLEHPVDPVKGYSAVSLPFDASIHVDVVTKQRDRRGVEL